MTRLTITEALADIKTIGKRLQAKRETVLNYIARHENIRDPFESDGGSRVMIERERQGVNDLEKRLVNLRTSIQKANHATPVTIAGVTRTIADWLTWRKEVAPSAKTFAGQIRNVVATVRKTEKTGKTAQGQEVPAGQWVVNVDEKALAKELEDFETILGTLDGQLSLTNATTFVEIAD